MVVERSGFFAGQIGALIRLDTQDDASLLATATKTEIYYKYPESGTTGSWTATIDGTKLTYTTTAVGDLPEAGEYFLQTYIEGPGWKIPGKKVVMLVEEPIIPIT
jgi:hypothetical protein